MGQFAMIMANPVSKRPRSTQRTPSELLLSRARWLDPEDRALLEQVLDRGVASRDLATVAGVTPRTIQRRVARLIRRLEDSDVLTVLRRQYAWPAQTAAVAMAVIVRGCTLQQTARLLETTLHDVRKHLEQARGLIDVQRNLPPAHAAAHV